MQKLIEQIYSTDEDLECQKCKTNRGTFVSLSCDHKFCVICLSFMYVKHRKADPNQGTVKCIKCQTITVLHPSHLEIVTKTLKQQVLPNIEGDNHQLTVSKSGYGLQYTETINRKIKSQQHSFQHNITPSTTKCFFSKCQSPSSRKKNMNSKFNCIIHKGQPITHLCFTCQMQPLCIKCISSSKKHTSHQVKDVQKSIAIASQQASITRFEMSQKIQQIQLWKRRIQDRSIIIKDRATQILSDIRSSFQNIFCKLQQKCQQITSVCQANFQQLLQKNNDKINAIQQTIQIFKAYHDKIVSVQRDSQNLDFIFKLAEIKHQYYSIKPNNVEIQIQSKVKLPSNSIFKQMDNLTVQVNRLTVSFKSSNLSRVGTVELQNCRSESKLRKQHNKRLKTNFVSLNSSRQKKQKKNTKTQEDQRRLRTQKHNMIDKKSNKMPAYISDFINKKNHKYGTDASSYALQLTSPNIQISKLTSKLSKTISPQQLHRKKKDNMALIKQRMERKTTQPIMKNKPQSSKKKKMH